MTGFVGPIPPNGAPRAIVSSSIGFVGGAGGVGGGGGGGDDPKLGPVSGTGACPGCSGGSCDGCVTKTLRVKLSDMGVESKLLEQILKQFNSIPPDQVNEDFVRNIMAKELPTMETAPVITSIVSQLKEMQAISQLKDNALQQMTEAGLDKADIDVLMDHLNGKSGSLKELTQAFRDLADIENVSDQVMDILGDNFETTESLFKTLNKEAFETRKTLDDNLRQLTEAAKDFDNKMKTDPKFREKVLDDIKSGKPQTLQEGAEAKLTGLLLDLIDQPAFPKPPQTVPEGQLHLDAGSKEAPVSQQVVSTGEAALSARPTKESHQVGGLRLAHEGPVFKSSGEAVQVTQHVVHTQVNTQGSETIPKVVPTLVQTVVAQQPEQLPAVMDTVVKSVTIQAPELLPETLGKVLVNVFNETPEALPKTLSVLAKTVANQFPEQKEAVMQQVLDVVQHHVEQAPQDSMKGLVQTLSKQLAVLDNASPTIQTQKSSPELVVAQKSLATSVTTLATTLPKAADVISTVATKLMTQMPQQTPGQLLHQGMPTQNAPLNTMKGLTALSNQLQTLSSQPAVSTPIVAVLDQALQLPLSTQQLSTVSAKLAVIAKQANSIPPQSPMMEPIAQMVQLVSDKLSGAGIQMTQALSTTATITTQLASPKTSLAVKEGIGTAIMQLSELPMSTPQLSGTLGSLSIVSTELPALLPQAQDARPVAAVLTAITDPGLSSPQQVTRNLSQVSSIVSNLSRLETVEGTAASKSQVAKAVIDVLTPLSSGTVDSGQMSQTISTVSQFAQTLTARPIPMQMATVLPQFLGQVAAQFQPAQAASQTQMMMTSLTAVMSQAQSSPALMTTTTSVLGQLANNHTTANVAQNLVKDLSTLFQRLQLQTHLSKPVNAILTSMTQQQIPSAQMGTIVNQLVQLTNPLLLLQARPELQSAVALSLQHLTQHALNPVDLSASLKALTQLLSTSTQALMPALGSSVIALLTHQLSIQDPKQAAAFLKEAATVLTLLQNSPKQVQTFMGNLIQNLATTLPTAQLIQVLESLGSILKVLTPTSQLTFIALMAQLKPDEQSAFLGKMAELSQVLPAKVMNELIALLESLIRENRVNMKTIQDLLQVFSQQTGHQIEAEMSLTRNMHDLKTLTHQFGEGNPKNVLQSKGEAGQTLLASSFIGTEEQKKITHLKQVSATQLRGIMLSKDESSKAFMALFQRMFSVDQNEDVTGGKAEWEAFLDILQQRREEKDREDSQKRRAAFLRHQQEEN